jgi:hypothetical protein
MSREKPEKTHGSTVLRYSIAACTGIVKREKEGVGGGVWG